MQITPHLPTHVANRSAGAPSPGSAQTPKTQEAGSPPGGTEESVTLGSGSDQPSASSFQKIVRALAGTTGAVVGATAGAAVGGLSNSDSGKVEMPNFVHRLSRKAGALTGLAAGLAVGLSGGVVALAAGAVLGPIVGSILGGGLASGLEAGVDATVGAAQGAKSGAVSGWQSGTGLVDKLFDRFARSSEDGGSDPSPGAPQDATQPPQEPILLGELAASDRAAS